MIAHVVFHPPEGDFSVKTVLSGAFPLLWGEGQQEIHMFAPDLGEVIEDLTRVLAAIVALDRPKRIVVAWQIGIVFFHDTPGALEIDLFPIAQMGQEIHNPPAAIAAGAVEIIFIVRGKQQPSQIVRKTGKVFQNLLTRTSGWFDSLPEVST